MEIIIEKDKERKRLLKIKGQGTAYQEVTKSKIAVDMYAVDKEAQTAMQALQEGVQDLLGILLDLGISREDITLGTVQSEPIYAEGPRAWFRTIRKVECYELKQKVDIEFAFDAELESKVLGKVYDVDYGSVLVRFGEKPVVPSYRSKGNFFSPIDDMEVESQPDYLAGFRSQPVEEKEVVVVYWEILN